MNTTPWIHFKSGLEILSFNVMEYVRYLESNTEKVMEVHQSPTHMCSPGSSLYQSDMCK